MCVICTLFEEHSGHDLKGAVRHYAEGDAMFREGDTITGVHVLHYGTVALLKRDPRTGDMMTYIAVPGDLLGMPGVMIGSCYINSATALDNVETVFISREDFLELARKHPDVILQSMRRLCDRIHFLEEQIDWAEGEQEGE
jgi:CRP/FNR family transcriptional regulator